MSKIRINELARQLEVKSREVIDKLHELGIAEKVTHSSSIDEDKADQLRRYYKGESYAPRPITHPNGAGVAAEDHAAEDRAEAAPPKRTRAAAPPVTAPAPAHAAAAAKTDAPVEAVVPA